MHSPPPDVLAHPSVQRLKRVAIAIGDLVEEVVFIGGAVSPLLQETPALDQARVTQDVDGIIATTTYTEMSGVGARLEARGFNRSATGKHVHQWISPDSGPRPCLSSLCASRRVLRRCTLRQPVHHIQNELGVFACCRMIETGWRAGRPGQLGGKHRRFAEYGQAPLAHRHERSLQQPLSRLTRSVGIELPCFTG